jgi:pimeloyl-ACP methyl ester carboxylesterase
MKFISIIVLLLKIVILQQFVYTPAFAQKHSQFSVAATEKTEAINGQIDWPRGNLEQWNDSVVIFISSGNPNDRDGWLVRSLETVWSDRVPLRDLSAALVKEGLAVVRFDNPGVLPPKMKCHEMISIHGLTTEILRTRCVNEKVLGDFTEERYIESIEKMLFHVQKIIPAARHNLSLFGFSEGLVHAAYIANRANVKVASLLSMGSPAENLESATRWQAIAREMETLKEFDMNSDRIISNDEIREGYKNGIGNFMNVEGWLSPYEYWDKNNKVELRARLENHYLQLYKETREGSRPGRLNWVAQANGVLVPDMTDSLWNLHFHGQIAPAEIMQRMGIPGLFLWGAEDEQVGLARQIRFIQTENKQGAAIQYVLFRGRHHLLSKNKDMDWAEKEFMQTIASKVRDFLKRMSP